MKIFPSFFFFFLSGLNFCKCEFHFHYKKIGNRFGRDGGLLLLLLLHMINGQNLLVAGPPIHSFYT
jgi:hypothetical protein